jgi:GNAT superfamily N-acetyltransferase
MDVRFRRATNADCPIAQQVVDRALRDYGLHVVLERGDRDLADLEAHYDARGGRFELIETGEGEVVGVVGWRPASDEVVELKKLYLTAHARGHGLGRRALDRVIDAARERGARAIVLETAAVLRDAVRLYARYGFVAVEGDAAGSFATLTDQCDRAYRLELTPPI